MKTPVEELKVRTDERGNIGVAHYLDSGFCNHARDAAQALLSNPVDMSYERLEAFSQAEFDLVRKDLQLASPADVLYFALTFYAAARVNQDKLQALREAHRKAGL